MSGLPEIEEYNRYVGVYRLVDYTLKDARIMALEAERILLIACRGGPLPPDR